MVDLPTGTVTFLFTDIEDSTGLLTALSDRYPALLARHNALLREAFERHGGVEVMTEGDAFFVVFSNPVAAVRAAGDAQRALRAEQWPEGREVRVRMGLHTGEAVLGGDNYVGLDVHRASRVASAGHGGQTLLSDATRGLVEQGLSAEFGFRDLGRHRLKGLPAPERIFQLTAADIPSDFPPIRSLEARANNLPVSLTSFIGRERQVAEITERLSSTRLLTLTGPGGTGKTRLGIRVAEEVIGEYEDGCWFVALDLLRDPELVPVTIADVLRLKVPPDQSAISALESWLAERRVLLVLDNFEQVPDAAGHVAALLDAAPRLRVLVTSRVPLGLYGEQEYPVPPLASATELRLAATASAEALSQYEAVQLFIERSISVKPDFRVTNANAPAVAEICARLDGLPLAIELAAARIKLLSPEQMLDRLAQSLSLLASTAQNLPARQRTLRGAIDWSYDLLSESEQRLFGRLSVFRGGFTLDAAEQVTAGAELGADVLEGVSSLVNKSLLRTEEQAVETRFAMLQTIREYARERLSESGEASAVMKSHALHFFGLARESEDQLMGTEQVQWLERLDREHDNLRAAFERATELRIVDEALTAAGAMWRYWQLRAHFAEARGILERLLKEPAVAPEARARALTGAGGIAYWQGDSEATGRHYREASALYESIGDRVRLADSLYNESYVPLLLGEPAAARPLLERAVPLFREAGNEIGATEAEWLIGFSYFMEGQPAQSLPFAQRALEAYRAAGARWSVADSLLGLAYVQAAMGQWPQAAASTRESLGVFRELGNDLGQSMVFEAVGAYAAWLGDGVLSARLLGKAERMKEQLGGGAPSQLFDTQAYREKARRDLGHAEFDRLAAEGAELTTEEAVALAESFDPAPDAPALQRLNSGTAAADVG
jgi:predicted ATPase/class 3 adenylate cyclase